jgi:hypothetical protein
MRYRKLTDNLDFSFGASQLDFYRDVPAAVGQAAQTRLLLWLGEWFLNIDEGTPYMIGVIGKHEKSTADATIQDRVQNTLGMVSIENYASVIDPDNRNMSVTMDINTVYGPTQVQIENYVNF